MEFHDGMMFVFQSKSILKAGRLNKVKQKLSMIVIQKLRTKVNSYMILYISC